MMLLEILESKTTNTPVQIFATDLSEQAISKARIGVYTKQELETVSPKRIQRFFIKADGGYRVNKAVRDMCVFAPHNILHDPPFSRLDFISCCNLFIYLDNAAQKKAVNTFHYALHDDGFLMLGKSENITHSANLFTGFNKKYKIFSRKINSGARTLPQLSQRFAQQTLAETNAVSDKIRDDSKNKTKKKSLLSTGSVDNAIDTVLLSEFMPASVAINHQMEIVQFRGTTDLYLTHPKGKATFNIIKMARPEIAFELRNAIAKAIKTNHRVRKSGIEIKTNSVVRVISLEVVPLKIESDEPLLLILFTEQEQVETFPHSNKKGKNNSATLERRIKKLEQELATAHSDALALSQEQEAFTEELQSANEEVVSSNEELQTVNEELETSKEEIESANEELITTNQELQTRNDLLNESYEYSQAILETLHNPFLILDKNHRVKSANKTFYKTFKVAEEETEGVLLYELGSRQWNIPRLRELLEEILPRNSHFQDFEVSHNFKSIGEKIMLLNARRIIQKMNHEELILLAITDITEIRKLAFEKELAEKKVFEQEIEAKKKSIETYKAADAYIRNVFMQTPVSIVVYKGPDFVVDIINEKALEMWGTTSEKVINRPLFEINPQLREQGMEKILNKVYTTGEPFIGNEIAAKYTRNEKQYDGYFNFVLSPVRELNGTISGITAIGTDVTAEVTARKKIEESEFSYHNMIYSSPSMICILKGEDLKIDIANDSILETWGKGKDVIGKSLLEVLPEIIEQGFEIILKNVYKTGKPYFAYEMPVNLMRNGKMELSYYTFVYQPQRDLNDAIIGVAIIASEVTPQALLKQQIKQSEERYRELSKTLEDKVDERTAELEIANESLEQKNTNLEKLNKELEAFTYVSSHDLQEPLRKIQTFAGRLLEKENQNLSDNGKNYFRLMQKEAQRMQTLIQDLLTFSRLNMADRKFETTDLNIIIEEVKNEFKDAIAKKQAVIEVKEICEVKIIPFQFRQLMHNLISNALKFSNPEIPPHITIESRNIKYSQINIANLPPQKEYCHITIIDNGIGFEKEFAEKIFEVFQKLHGKEEYAGTGIGLAIVKKIVDNHNGIITATSELNKGTTFDIYIPT